MMLQLFYNCYYYYYNTTASECYFYYKSKNGKIITCRSKRGQTELPSRSDQPQGTLSGPIIQEQKEHNTRKQKEFGDYPGKLFGKKKTD